MRHATTAITSDTNCQSQIISSSLNVDAWTSETSIDRWWCLEGNFSVASDLLQSISMEFSGLQSVSMCLWHGRMTISRWLHFKQGTQSLTVVSQYSCLEHVDEAKLSGIKVANNTTSNDDTIELSLKLELGRFRSVLWCWWLMWFDRLWLIASIDDHWE